VILVILIPLNIMKNTKNSMHQRLILAIMLTILFTAACSQIRIAYFFVDWYIVDRIDDYLDISDDQEKFLDDKVDLLHAWHRKEELPKIVTFLKSLKIKLAKGLSEEDIPWFQSEYKAIQSRAIDKISDDFVVFLGTVTPQQIDHLAQAVKKKNEEHYERNFKISEKLWREKRIQRTLENLEDFFGTLTKEQNKLITSSIEYKREDYLRQFEQRQQVQKKIEAVLRSQESPEKIKNVFLSWILDPDEIKSDMYKKFSKQRTAKWVKFWLTVEDTITAKQRNVALEKIQDYIETIESMANGKS
jgi:hypothetical protein